jgi:hypothetical protein
MTLDDSFPYGYYFDYFHKIFSFYFFQFAVSTQNVFRSSTKQLSYQLLGEKTKTLERYNQRGFEHLLITASAFDAAHYQSAFQPTASAFRHYFMN